MGRAELIGKLIAGVNPRDGLVLEAAHRVPPKVRARRNLRRQLCGVLVAEDADGLLKLLHFERLLQDGDGAFG